jgi:hypothetical protein
MWPLLVGSPDKLWEFFQIHAPYLVYLFLGGKTLLYIFLKSITIQHLRTSKASGAPVSHHTVITEFKILKNVVLELPTTAHCL